MSPTFLLTIDMAHPLIPDILNLATPIAADLNLEIINAIFQTNYNPPVLRLDIRNVSKDTSLNDCESMSRALEAALDRLEVIPNSYVLEISSPGIPKNLTTDRQLISFKGFPIIVHAQDPDQNLPKSGVHKSRGHLTRHDEAYLYLSQKGRIIKIARAKIISIQLADP